MMQQIVLIHGGNSFPTHAAYLDFLTNAKIDNAAYFKRTRDWKANMASDLGDEYEVFTHQMPNKSNARYNEWKIWFEKLLPFLRDDVVLVGHSLGASFLTRYLAEERLPIRAKALMLVAGAYSADLEDMAPEFAAPESLMLATEQVEQIFLYHSKDDPVVPFKELSRYESALPKATSRVFEDKKHFNQEHFPELVADIKNV